jgi:hypothetical protein
MSEKSLIFMFVLLFFLKKAGWSFKFPAFFYCNILNINLITTKFHHFFCFSLERKEENQKQGKTCTISR